MYVCMCVCMCRTISTLTSATLCVQACTRVLRKHKTVCARSHPTAFIVCSLQNVNTFMYIRVDAFTTVPDQCESQLHLVHVTFLLLSYYYYDIQL